MADRERMNLAMKPDWMMVGGPGPLGCRLIASAKLLKGEISSRFFFDELFADSWLAPPVVGGEITMACTMFPPDMVIIDAPDYQACLAELWRIWSPERGKLPAIEAGA